MKHDIKRIVAPLSIKSLDDETGTFTGYASVFGNIDSYGDTVVRGAFANFLAENAGKSIPMLWQHNASMPIGSFVDMREDDQGLFVKGLPLINDVRKAKEAYALVKSGVISGLSIGFNIKPGGSKMAQDGVRYLTDLELWEISVVTFAANRLAKVTGLKSIKNISTIREFERCLRDLGVSKKQAVALSSIAAKGFESRSDSDGQFLDALQALHQSINPSPPELKNE